MGRPVRRSARTPAKAPAKIPVAAAPPSSPLQGSKRKTRDTDKGPEEKLEYLLTNAKSKLTRVDISEIVNYSTFLELSEEAQARLCALLPPTAFSTYVESVCTTHPDFDGAAPPRDDGMDVDGDDGAGGAGPDGRTPATLDPTVFTSPFFLSAAHTFQDHLFSSWLGKKASDDLERFLRGAREGSLSADWKDEVWEREHRREETRPKRKKRPTLDMAALAKRGLLREGDVLAYKRTFPTLNVTVEKDILVDKINPSTHMPSFLLAPGTETALPASVLAGASDTDTKMLAIDDLADPIALERGVLDVDGRVSYADKAALELATLPSSNATGTAESDEALRNAIAVRAWKAFRVWRTREGDLDELQGFGLERGGRERLATLFYLRGYCAGGS